MSKNRSNALFWATVLIILGVGISSLVRHSGTVMRHAEVVHEAIVSDVPTPQNGLRHPLVFVAHLNAILPLSGLQSSSEVRLRQIVFVQCNAYRCRLAKQPFETHPQPAGDEHDKGQFQI